MDAYVAGWETFYGFEDEKEKNEKMRDAYVCETFYGFEDEKMRNAYVAIDILCKTETFA